MTNTGKARMDEQRAKLLDLGFTQPHGFLYRWVGTGRKVEFSVTDEEACWTVTVFEWVDSPRRPHFEGTCSLQLNSVPTPEFVAIASALKAVQA